MRKVWFLFLFITLLGSPASADEDKEWAVELSSKTTSQVFERPPKADDFCWDTDEHVQAELAFDDGSKNDDEF